MWKSNDSYCTDKQLLESLRQMPKGSIMIIDGPSGCGKTRLLKQLSELGGRALRIYSIGEFKEMLSISIRHPHRTLQNLFFDDIVAVEDIDFLGITESLQTQAAFFLRHAAENGSVILTGIRINERVPIVVDSFRKHGKALRIWEYDVWA